MTADRRALLSILLLASLAPPAAANVGVCADDVLNPGYADCWGVADRCYGNGTKLGVGQWSYGPTGPGGTTCAAYVFDGNSDGYRLTGVCTDLVSPGYTDCYGRIVGANGLSCIGGWFWQRAGGALTTYCLA